MGYLIKFVARIKIKRSDADRFCDLTSEMHSDENLLKYAHGGCYPVDPGTPVSQQKWYSFVKNKKYATVEEVFHNWGFHRIQYERPYDSDFLIFDAHYNTKIGQVNFLFTQIASVLEDTSFAVKGEDGKRFRWIIEDHTFREEEVEADDV